MIQQILPLIPHGASCLNDYLSIIRKKGIIQYFYCGVCIASHPENETSSFKREICQLISNGVCRNTEVIRVFGVSKSSLKRWLKTFRENGEGVFFSVRSGRGPSVLVEPLKSEIQSLFDTGKSISEVAKDFGIKYDTIRKAVNDGRLRPPVVKRGLDRSERSKIDAGCELGIACVRTMERVFAAMGKIDHAAIEFQKNFDIEKGGVLCALPALIENGLYRHIPDEFELPPGYYDTVHIVSLLAFMVLSGINIVERLRFESPGEMGKLLGLDRIPEVKILREKLSSMCHSEEAVAQWSEQLTRDWFNAKPELAGVLYVDGHVSLYYGNKTPLPRRYCARLRLCMRGSTFYYVNDILGQPFFFVEQVVDEGLLRTMRNIIVPKLLDLVPNQPSDEALEKDEYLYRFILVFDREGYSPDFFREMWEKHRIGCITYHKYPGEKWPEEDFIDVKLEHPDGETETAKLAERITNIGENKVKVREVRKLTESGHQTSIITTLMKLDMGLIAIYMFSRWVQENFFKYMLYVFNIDALIEYGTKAFSGPVRVINPLWKKLDTRIRSITSKLISLRAKFGKLELTSENNPKKLEKMIREKAELRTDVEQFEHELVKLKEEKKTYPKHISFDELPDDLKFEQLKPTKRLLFDTIKILVYRAETAMANTLKEKLDRNQDARSLIRQLMKTHADIIPDNQNKILKVRLHGFTAKRHDRAMNDLLTTLNETETLYPGTDMKLVYSMVGNDTSLINF